MADDLDRVAEILAPLGERGERASTGSEPRRTWTISSPRSGGPAAFLVSGPPIDPGTSVEVVEPDHDERAEGFEEGVKAVMEALGRDGREYAARFVAERFNLPAG